jgi:hypothetical protein
MAPQTAADTIEYKVGWIESFLEHRGLFANEYDRLWKLLESHRLNERDSADGAALSIVHADQIMKWLIRKHPFDRPVRRDLSGDVAEDPTPDQITLIRTLIAERPGIDPAYTQILAVHDARTDTLTKAAAKAMIRALIAIPRPVRDRDSQAPRTNPFVGLADEDEAFYALVNPDTRDRENPVIFLKVDKPREGRWAGKAFIKREYGGPRYEKLTYQQQADYARAILAMGVAASMTLYGQTSDHCCYCHRTLSRRTPRFNGRGNDCAKARGFTQAKPPADWRPEIQDAA